MLADETGAKLKRWRSATQRNSAFEGGEISSTVVAVFVWSPRVIAERWLITRKWSLAVTSEIPLFSAVVAVCQHSGKSPRYLLSAGQMESSSVGLLLAKFRFLAAKFRDRSNSLPTLV